MKLPLILMVLIAFCAVPSAAADGDTSCLTCHRDSEMFDEDMIAIVESFADDVHGEVGLSCQDCHGGNPSMEVAEDMDAAMDPAFAANPYFGVPDRAEIPDFCGGCHADASYMKRFKPDPRIDQVEEYWTSHHGKSLAQGETRVATCVDCHGIHGILRPGNPNSPVYPTKIAETCRSCHGDADRMAGFTRADGSPLPVDQYARWRRSVHAVSLLDKEDLSAPTCNDCHGNHGATPPGLESVGLVCGQCHGREAALFNASSKRDGFREHNAFLSDAEGAGCIGCHDSPEPQATVTTVRSFVECATCHENHAIVRPTVAMLGPLPETPCAICHEGQGLHSENVPEPEKILAHYEEVRDGLLQEAAEAGLEGDERFDWFVDRAETLPWHSTSGSEGSVLRSHFARLFEKFRIGKTHYTYIDPVSEKEVGARILRCNDCHGPEPQVGDSADGYLAGEYFLTRMHELTALTARAERILLSAQRGGVEIGEAMTALDNAIDSQIELEVLVHTFDTDPEGEFAKKQAEGLEYAQAALVAGQHSLDELSNRRQGLIVALALIFLVLVGVGLKIRQLSGGA